MKKTLLVLLFAVLAMPMAAQKVFKLAYATSDDGFVNIRATATANGKILGRVESMYGGVGNAMVLGTKGNWTKVRSIDGKTGFAVTKYLGFSSWYEGGNRVLVTKSATPLYWESFGDDAPVSKKATFTIPAGTIIADANCPTYKNYYVLESAHDNLYIPKKYLKVVNK